KVTGIDVSETGIRTADRLYGRFGITFTVADIHTAVFPERFDCLFVRSCSLYNTAGFAADDEPTRELLRPVKPNGTVIVAHNPHLPDVAGALGPGRLARHRSVAGHLAVVQHRAGHRLTGPTPGGKPGRPGHLRGTAGGGVGGARLESRACQKPSPRQLAARRLF